MQETQVLSLGLLHCRQSLYKSEPARLLSPAFSAYSAANQPLHSRVIIVCQPLYQSRTQRHLRRFPADGREIRGTSEDPAWGLPPGAKAVAKCGEYVAAWYPHAKAVKIFRLSIRRFEG